VNVLDREERNVAGKHVSSSVHDYRAWDLRRVRNFKDQEETPGKGKGSGKPPNSPGSGGMRKQGVRKRMDLTGKGNGLFPGGGGYQKKVLIYLGTGKKGGTSWRPNVSSGTWKRQNRCA